MAWKCTEGDHILFTCLLFESASTFRNLQRPALSTDQMSFVDRHPNDNSNKDVTKRHRDWLDVRQEITETSAGDTPTTELPRTTSGSDTSSETSSASDVRPTMINAPSQIGLIMPNPGSNVYTGENHGDLELSR